MIRFELSKFNERYEALGYKSIHPICVPEKQEYAPLASFFDDVLKYNYTEAIEAGKRGHNIDNWLTEINERIESQEDEDFHSDSVSIFFEKDKVKFIYYWDWKVKKDMWVEVDIHELKKLVLEWKEFVIDWYSKVKKNT